MRPLLLPVVSSRSWQVAVTGRKTHVSLSTEKRQMAGFIMTLFIMTLLKLTDENVYSQPTQLLYQRYVGYI